MLTNFSLSDLTDADMRKKSLDKNLFPTVPSWIKVHSGFANQHAKTARDILAQVNLTISHTGANSVYVVSSTVSRTRLAFDIR